MSSFTTELIVSPLPDGLKWVIREGFSYDIGEKGSRNTVTVPAGFVTDFTSTPKMLRSILPNWGKYGKAAIVHDYLYFSHKRSKKESDKIFYEGMIILGVHKWKAKLIYQAVNLFGGNSYKKPSGYMTETTDEYIEIKKLKNI